MYKPKTLLTIGIGTLILSLIGLYNGYPLVYSDTGTYIYSGFDKFIPNDRPITYGLFLRLFSLGHSAWFVIIIQNLITAFVLHEILKVFSFKNKGFSRLYYSILLFLVMFTGIGWYSNQLMPDFFAPLLILIIFILLKGESVSISSKIILIPVLIYALITHFSHLLIGSALVILILLFSLIFGSRFIYLPLKRIILVAAIVLSGWIILPSINYLTEKQFIISKGSHVFLMAHLNDTGILEKFLNENCSTPEFQDCRLCQFKDSLPTDLASFIWAGNILEKTGGWKDSKEEYNKIIIATLTRPKYLLLNFYRSVTYGIIQLTQNEIGQGLSPYTEGSPPYGQIHWRFHSELNNYLNSRQNKWNGVNLKFEALNTVNLFILVLSLFFVILLFSNSLHLKIDPVTKMFLIFVILSIVVNSFMTAGLNSPCERFQARVVWLLPFSLIILFVRNNKVIFKTVFKRLRQHNK